MYRNVVGALATRHGKRAALAAPLRRAVGLRLRVPDVDTDALGTFTGEVPRTAPADRLVVTKARLGAAAAGCPVGVASEGSFGPHPAAPWCPLDVEHVALVDDRIGLVLVERAASTDTNHAELLTDGDDRAGLLTFARRVGLPGHALTVLPAVPPAGTYPMVKGIVRLPALLAAVTDAAAASRDGRARVAADLRAHHNPRRMRVIAEAGRRLARRLATRCPACAGPGWGVVGTRPGLPCRACGTATERVGEMVHGCPLCDHRVTAAVADAGEPAECPRCNP